MRHRSRLALLPLLGWLLVSGCGDDPAPARDTSASRGAAAITRDDANAKTTITVGSKAFTEQRVLGEVFAQGLAAAGYKVRKQLNLGNEMAAQDALRHRTIDGYPEYTGTALLALCDVPAASVPKDPAEAFADTQACFAEKGLTALPPTPFTSSNEVAVRQAVADEYGLQKISDLAKVDQDFTLYGSTECRHRTDCLLGLEQTYGLKFERFAPVAIDLRHSVLGRGDQVASIVFTTDPQNRRDGLVLLEDDKGMFPPNNSTFVVRDEVADEAGPALPKVIALLNAGLTDEVMQELNARVDIDDESPDAVARQYLEEAGLVGPS